MSSKTQIFNDALALLGQEEITSADERVRPAMLLRNTWDISRDAALRAHPWNFAVERRALAEAIPAPDTTYSFAYALPTDPYCLRVLSAPGCHDGEWDVEGRRILTDAGSPFIIRYIARVDDPERFDAAFTEALAAKLAANIALGLTGVRALAGEMRRLFLARVDEARGVDAQESRTKRYDTGRYIAARQTYRRTWR